MKNYLLSLILATAAATHAEPLLIDLPTALRLADEKNTDLAIQVQKVTLAELDRSAAWYQWIPTLRVGASYGWQNGALQETDGNIIDVERNSRYAGMGAGAYGAGMPIRPGLSMGVDLSEAEEGVFHGAQELLRDRNHTHDCPGCHEGQSRGSDFRAGTHGIRDEKRKEQTLDQPGLHTVHRLVRPVRCHGTDGVE